MQICSESTESYMNGRVHGYQVGLDPSAHGQIKWRNILVRSTNLEDHSRTSDPQVKEISYLKNELTDHERRHGRVESEKMDRASQ